MCLLDGHQSKGDFTMEQKLRVGILGATGMVGQRFIALLENHPWYEVVAVRQARVPQEKPMRRRWGAAGK